ncbi:MAG: SpoVR family protein, partial [Chloroflexota bacterium]|nr:SpoVR family protein [Chloroflexota bacterium]
LESWIARIWDKAAEFGLDPYPTHFEIVPATIMYEFGSYGLPGRFSHWTHGRAYHQMKTMYDYGLSKIYELVINTNPCYAFLMEANTPLENKLVVAHVLAHCDFFRHNAYFGRTNRQMLETASVNAERIRRYEFDHGTAEVERFLDAVLSIEEHVDPVELPGQRVDAGREQDKREKEKKTLARTTPYDDVFALGQGKEKSAPSERERRKVPAEPQRDLLGFLMEHASDLEDWQRDVISIVRLERLYFVPQMRTKILNEGWASLWHARILRELDLPSDEYTEFARLHSSVAAPSRRNLNPYYVGMKMLEYVEQRWDAPSAEDRQRLGLKGGEGRAKLFETRELESDLSFMRTHLTRNVVEELDLYIYEYEGGEWKVVEKNWELVRDQIVRSLTSYGIPYITVEDGDYKRSRELHLKHHFEGDELDARYAEKTLHYVQRIWRRPVHLETVVDDKPVLLTYDGTRNTKATR